MGAFTVLIVFNVLMKKVAFAMGDLFILPHCRSHMSDLLSVSPQILVVVCLSVS